MCFIACVLTYGCLVGVWLITCMITGVWLDIVVDGGNCWCMGLWCLVWFWGLDRIELGLRR